LMQTGPTRCLTEAPETMSRGLLQFGREERARRGEGRVGGHGGWRSTKSAECGEERRGGGTTGVVDGVGLSALSRWGETRGEWLTGPWTRTRWLTVLVDRGSAGNMALSIVLHSRDTGEPVRALSVWYAP